MNPFVRLTPFLDPEILWITRPDLSSTHSQYSLLTCCHPISPTNHLLIANHRSLIQICITSSLESTSILISSASPVLSRFTSTFTCQPILVIIPVLSIHTLSLFHSRLKTYIFHKSHLIASGADTELSAREANRNTLPFPSFPFPTPPSSPSPPLL